MVYSLLPGSWALIKPQQVRMRLYCFSGGQTPVRTGWFSTGQNGYPFRSPVRGRRGSFSSIQCKDLGELLEEKLTKKWGSPMRPVHTELPALVNYKSSVSTMALVPIPEISACGLVVILFINRSSTLRAEVP